MVDIKTSAVDQDPSLQSDGAFVSVLSDMIDKTENGAYKIDPLKKDERRKLIDKLSRVKSISYPEEVFQFSISGETEACIKNQINSNMKTVP